MRDIKGVLIDLDGVVHGQFVWWGKKAGRMARARGHGAFGGECAYQRSLLEMIDASVLSDGDVKCSLFTALGRRRALVRSLHARF